MTRATRVGTFVGGILLFLAAACGSVDQDAAETPERETLTIFAAASLNAAFTKIGETFEADHAGVTVRFNFAGSADLVAQIQQGAPADVFASADTANMSKATSAGRVAGTPVDFATNMLTIAVPPDNPADVDSLDDLVRPGVALVLCAPAVPCGSAAAVVEKVAGIDFRPVSEEQSVTDVVNKVRAGTAVADAGLVYVTDVQAAGADVLGIAFPEAAAAVTHCPIAVLAGSRQAELAREFVDFVLGSEARSILDAAGFGQPR